MLSENELKYIKNKYQLSHHLRCIETINTGDVNAAYILSDGTQKFVIKKINKRKYMNDYQVSLHDLMDSLSFSEQIVEQMEFTKHTNPALKIGNEYLIHNNHFIFLLYPYLKAETLINEDISALQVQRIAKFLYQIHQTPFDFEEYFAKEKFKTFQRFAQQVLNHQIWRILRMVTNQSFILPKLNQVSDHLVKHYAAFELAISNMDRQTICHNDLKPKNVIWKDLQFWVVDWETAGLFDKMSDYMDTVISWCTTYGGQYVEIDKVKTQTFFKEYPIPEYQNIEHAINIVLLKWYFWLGFCLKKLIQHPLKQRDYIGHARYAIDIIIFLTQLDSKSFLFK